VPRPEQRAIEQNGTPNRPKGPAILESWQASMMAAHCNVISEDRAFRLALKQWKRDVNMANIASQGNCILIAGRAHVKNHSLLGMLADTRTSTILLTDKGADHPDKSIVWMASREPSNSC